MIIFLFEKYISVQLRQIFALETTYSCFNRIRSNPSHFDKRRWCIFGIRRVIHVHEREIVLQINIGHLSVLS